MKLSIIHHHVKRGLSKHKGKDKNGNPIVPVIKIFANKPLSGPDLYLRKTSAVIGTRKFINKELAASSYAELKPIRLMNSDLSGCKTAKQISEKIKSKIKNV